MTDRSHRAEEARRKILESGDRELINRLHLLEATAGQAPGGQPATPAAPAARQGGGPGLLGTGLAVAGGAYLGTVLAGMTLSGEMQQAFASVAEDLGIDVTDADFAAMEGGETAETGEVVEASEDGGFLDDMGLGDIGDIFDV